MTFLWLTLSLFEVYPINTRNSLEAHSRTVKLSWSCDFGIHGNTFIFQGDTTDPVFLKPTGKYSILEDGNNCTLLVATSKHIHFNPNPEGYRIMLRGNFTKHDFRFTDL